MNLTLAEHRKLGRLLKQQRDLLLKLNLTEAQLRRASQLNDKIRDLLDDNMHENFDEKKCSQNYFG